MKKYLCVSENCCTFARFFREMKLSNGSKTKLSERAIAINPAKLTLTMLLLPTLFNRRVDVLCTLYIVKSYIKLCI